ncbi:hypothetical protein QW131_23535 [Roseibium salinum]|nr:hypothetical protein [Roseibium salinum]
MPIGRLLLLISLLMIIPAMADVFASNPDWQVFLTSALVLGTTGVLMTLAFRGERPPGNFREALIFVNAAWFAFFLRRRDPLLFQRPRHQFHRRVFLKPLQA